VVILMAVVLVIVIVVIFLVVIIVIIIIVIIIIIIIGRPHRGLCPLQRGGEAEGSRGPGAAAVSGRRLLR
jgi:hypothetical protein